MQKTQEEVAAILRRRITDGTYPPGSRMPVRALLERELETSRRTMQFAFDRLIAEGYVESRHWAGTFVAASPPHLCRLCLFTDTFFEHATKTNCFYRAIAGSAQQLQKRFGITIEVIDQVNSYTRYDKILRLADDVRKKRLAGIIFMGINPDFAGTPIFDDPEIARIAIASASRFNIPIVKTDGEAFYRRGLKRLAEVGCRRPAILGYMPKNIRIGNTFQAYFEEAGLEYNPIREQFPDLRSDVSFEHQLRLLYALPENLRPDGILCCDDNRLACLAELLRELAVEPHDPPRVIVQANYPELPACDFPITRLGVETDLILQRCVEHILAQNRGEAIPAETTAPTIFEWERDANQSKSTATAQ